MSAEDYEPMQHLKRARAELRRLHSVGCPVCLEKFPKASPKKLLPGEMCERHKYRDPRPRVPKDEWTTILKKHGLTEIKNDS